MERKSIPFELKDIDTSKRTAVIAHSIYNNIDLTGDISRKGMFNKSWLENKSDINFYLNHNDEQAPGKVTDVYEDDNAAYTKAWLGTHTLGNDTLLMMDEGIIKKASFGFVTQKKNYIEVKGKKVRELKEVKHLETSVLTKLPANPLTGVVSVTKAFEDMPELKTLNSKEQSALKKVAANDHKTLMTLMDLSAQSEENDDLYTWVNYHISRRSDMLGDVKGQLKWNAPEMKELKEYLCVMEKFARNTKASDECIKSIQLEIENAKGLISAYNTALTQAGRNPLEPEASVEEKGFLDVLQSFKNSLNKN